MKIAVITRHAITNYGSLLQAIATQKVIENLGHSCDIIDYIRDDESYRKQEKTILKHKSNWNQNPIKRVLYLALRQPESIASGKKFEKDRKNFLNLTRSYTSPESLKDHPPLADVYVTGSDQVWGPVGDGIYDDSYCLSFTDGKKIAYAASFGHTEITPQLERYYRKRLSQYKHIAVREDSAVEILKNWELNAYQVIDPTLLLDDAFWDEYAKPIKKGKYVLAYQLHNDKSLGKYARSVAKAMRLPLIRVSTSFHQIFREGRLVWCPELGEFLSYIKNAECLITDSFHGTAFAINFNTPFVEILPNNNTGTRNMSLLKLLGLSDRILRDETDIELALRKMDFAKTNEILRSKRSESLGIFRAMIEE